MDLPALKVQGRAGGREARMSRHTTPPTSPMALGILDPESGSLHVTTVPLPWLAWSFDADIAMLINMVHQAFESLHNLSFTTALLCQLLKQDPVVS